MQGTAHGIFQGTEIDEIATRRLYGARIDRSGMSCEIEDCRTPFHSARYDTMGIALQVYRDCHATLRFARNDARDEPCGTYSSCHCEEAAQPTKQSQNFPSCGNDTNGL